MRKAGLRKRQKVFGELLRQRREAQQVSQETLAKRLGRPQSFVSKVESAERRLDVVEFLALADALALNPLTILKQFQKG